MRRRVSVPLLFIVSLLVACAPTPTVIVREVPVAIVITATMAVTTATPTFEPPPTPSPTALPTPAKRSLLNAVVTGDMLNLRSQPSLDSETIGALDKGCELRAVGRTEEGDWLKVEFQGIQGWVAARYVELSVPLDTILVVAGVTEPPHGTPAVPPEHGVSGQVLRVLDGCTVEISINGETHRVRYLGIDTPETKQPEESAEWMGAEAAAQNERLVGGKTVSLEKDVVDRDDQGRLLRYVWVGDLMVNAELVRLGYARASSYPPHVKYQDLFLGLEEKAREARRGLWAAPGPTPEATQSVTPSPTILAAPPCPNAHARLTYPTQNAELEGVVGIRGSADIANLWYYKFEFRPEGGHEWAFLERFDTPVTDGVLGYWDTTALSAGWYDLRLVAVDNTGNYPAPCEVRVLVGR